MNRNLDEENTQEKSRLTENKNTKNEENIEEKVEKKEEKLDKNNEKREEEEKESNYDFKAPIWFYLDESENKQGPFSFKEIYLWWKGGYFSGETLIKNAWDQEFLPLDDVTEFSKISQNLIDKIQKDQQNELLQQQKQQHNQYYQGFYQQQQDHNQFYNNNPVQSTTTKSEFEDYSVSGGFNPVTGRFQKESPASYYGAKGLSSDRESRMMESFFDPNAYQEQMNIKLDEEKKRKQVKGSKKFWKERKETKKRAKLLADLADT